MSMKAADVDQDHEIDIEEDISRSNSQMVSGASSNSNRIVEAHEFDAATIPTPSKLTKLLGSVTSVPYVIYNFICSIIYVAIYFPCSLVAHLVSFSFTGTLQPVCLRCIWRRKKCHRRRRIRTEGGVYNKINAFESTLYKSNRIVVVLASRVGCLLLLWLLLNLCVPKLRRATLGGSLLWKWSLLATVVSLGYPSTYIVLGIFWTHFVCRWMSSEDDAFYYITYMQGSVRGLLYVSWVLLVWLLYFRSHRGLDLNSEAISKYVEYTLVSFQAGATLWGLKRLVWLQWRANAIYKRFKPRILRAGFQLFFLSFIVDRLPLRHIPRECVEQYMLSRKISIDQIDWIALLVAHLAKLESRETDDVSEIIDKYQKKIESNNNLWSEEYVTEEAIRKFARGYTYEADLFLHLFQLEYPSKTINEVPFLKWMVDAHKNCVSVGCTLLDAYATVNVLDTILTCCIVVAVIVLWLLLTELATSTVLVVITSSFLALTFVFGDTCKTFFQGVVFSFITHPFDVGDRCIIDGIEVEVKRINVLTTTCIKIGTIEKMLYPNTNLATKVIINLESKPDPRDVIELVLDSSTRKSHILRLRRRIRNFIGNDNRRDFYERSCQVMVKEIGNNIKISIHFNHIMTVQDASHTRFIEMKNRRRSQLLIKIKQFAEDLNIKLAQT